MSMWPKSWRTDPSRGDRPQHGLWFAKLFKQNGSAPLQTPRERPASEIRGVDHKQAVSALEGAGFWVLREGVHVVMTNGTRILTIPRQNPVNGITMDGIVRDAGLSAEEFRQLL
jgi:hypothetical protein